MVPILGNSSTKRRFGHAGVRLRPNQSLQPMRHMAYSDHRLADRPVTCSVRRHEMAHRTRRHVP